MTYLVEYAPSARSSCHWFDCQEKAIGLNELRIGMGKRKVWYHVDCFFNFLVELGPKTIKLQSWRSFLSTGRVALRDEAKKLLDDKVAHCHIDKETRKRKAEAYANDKYAKIAKLDLPPLFYDALYELLSLFGNCNGDLLTLACVNKQFYEISRKILFSREVQISHKNFCTTAKPTDFMMQIRKLKLPPTIPSKSDNEAYGQLITQLTNLESFNFPSHGPFVINAVKQLTQLKSLSIDWITWMLPSEAKNPFPVLDTFNELKQLTIGSTHRMHFKNELSLLEHQLTSLSLHYITLDNLSKFTKLEHLSITAPPSLNNKPLLTNLKQDAFDLPRLTSLRTNVTFDFMKWTQLRSLTISSVFPRSEVIKSLPPNLEHLSFQLVDVLTMLPSTLKSVTIGGIPKTLSLDDQIFPMLRSLSNECKVVLEYFIIPPVYPDDFLTKDNITIRILTSSYGSVTWDQISTYLRGALPQRLHLKFYKWSGCKYKSKMWELLKSVESRTRLLVDVTENQIYREREGHHSCYM